MTFTEYEDIVEGIDIKAYRNVQKALEAKKEKSSTKNKLIKEADKNKDLLIKEIFKLLLEEYECNSFAITNSDEKETIRITIPPLLEKDNYSEKEKKTINRYNESIDDTKIENKIYFHMINKNGIKEWTTVKLDLKKLEKADIINIVEFGTDCMFIYTDTKKIKDLTIKAHNNELDSELFDKDIIEMLNNSYLRMKAKEEEVKSFIDTMNTSYLKKVYLDIIKKLINEYKNNPYTESCYTIIKWFNNDTQSEYYYLTKIINDIYYRSNYDADFRSRIEKETFNRVILYPLLNEDSVITKVEFYPIIVKKLYYLLDDNFKSLEIHEKDHYTYSQVSISVDKKELEDFIISIQESSNPKKKIRQ